MRINGGANMFASICMAGLLGFVEFLKSAVFVVGYIQGGALFPEPLTGEEERKRKREKIKYGL